MNKHQSSLINSTNTLTPTTPLLVTSTISLSLLALTLLITTICTNTTNTHADDSTTDNISINVQAACTMNATDTTHSTNATPGQWIGDIGQSNVTTTCNDPGGYAIYAIGYTNNEYGNTNLINTTDSTKTIITGPNKSGTTSNWSMKLGKGTGDTATIMGETQGDTEDFYNDYHIVPSTYTKVAEKTSATDPTIIGTAFTTTYGVYTTTSQIAGTYTGQVKYTLVHPSTEPAPFTPQPVVTNPGFISYNTNAPTTEVTDSMGDQSISIIATSANLWASNFQRPGYGFAGWNTKPDYSGTSYGPNETISFTAGQYSGDNPGLSLYAMWIPSAGNLQDFTTTQCNTLTKANEVTSPTDILTQSLTALTDSRDNQTYAVARLADGNCWMIENLRLENTANHNSDGTLAQGYATSATYGNFSGLADPENTLTWNSSTTANSIYYSGTQSGTATIDIGTSGIPGYRFPRYNNQNTANPASNMTAWNNISNTYSVGNWYTWAAAIANTSYYTSGNHNTTSICPNGWHIPTGNTGGEFSSLDSAMGGTGGEQSTTEASMRWRTYPQNFVYSGYFDSGSPINRGDSGYYWSSTVGSYDNSYHLYLFSSKVYPGTINYGKYTGHSIRCLSGTP